MQACAPQPLNQGQVDLKYPWEETSTTSLGHSYSASYLHGHDGGLRVQIYPSFPFLGLRGKHQTLSIGIGSAAK